MATAYDEQNYTKFTIFLGLDKEKSCVILNNRALLVVKRTKFTKLLSVGENKSVMLVLNNFG